MSEKSTAVEKKGFKYYWSKFQALNGSSVFLAMIAAMIILKLCCRSPGGFQWRAGLYHAPEPDDDLPSDGLYRHHRLWPDPGDDDRQHRSVRGQYAHLQLLHGGHR